MLPAHTDHSTSTVMVTKCLACRIVDFLRGQNFQIPKAGGGVLLLHLFMYSETIPMTSRVTKLIISNQRRGVSRIVKTMSSISRCSIRGRTRSVLTTYTKPVNTPTWACNQINNEHGGISRHPITC